MHLSVLSPKEGGGGGRLGKGWGFDWQGFMPIGNLTLQACPGVGIFTVYDCL